MRHWLDPGHFAVFLVGGGRFLVKSLQGFEDIF